ncbi:MAG TPA: hypothetical protein PLN21_19575 [Gemmatales bacterium]|nr:hypothetical protein [Gemmatales bacterium]
MRNIHLFMGIAALIAFLGTGLNMHFGYDHLHGMTDARRLLFRSTHIYLLLTAMVNLALGMHLKPVTGWARWLQTVGSLVVLSTPVFAAVGFFTEPWLTELERPWSRACAYGCLAGMMLHLLAWLTTCPWKRESSKSLAN